MIASLRHLFTPQPSNNHRPRILHVEGIAVLAAITIASQLMISLFSNSSSGMPAILGFSSSITASQVVEQTNGQRQAAGLSSLSVDNRLVQAALAKGNDMCANQYWAHISPSGTTPWVFIKNAGYPYAVAGENLARDFSETGSMISAWMASPTHKANIVNTKYTEIGVAVLDCSLLGSDTALVVQMFGTQVAKAPSTPKPATTTQAAAVATSVPTIRPTAIPTLVPTPTIEPTPTPEATPSARVEGEESVPKLLVNADPTLVLSSQRENQPLVVFTPLQVAKAILLAILGTLIVVLFFDMWIAHSRGTVRIAGKNIAHILFLSGILLVVLIVKAGVIQ